MKQNQALDHFIGSIDPVRTGRMGITLESLWFAVSWQSRNAHYSGDNSISAISFLRD